MQQLAEVDEPLTQFRFAPFSLPAASRLAIRKQE